MKGEEDSRDKEVLSYDDLNLLCNSLNDFNDFKHAAYEVVLKIGYYTGLRISEVLALEKEDIDFKNDLIRINKKLVYKDLKKYEYYTLTQMKSKKSKATIPLALPLKKVLIKWFKSNPYNHVVCDIEGYYLNPNVLGNEMKKIGNKLSIHFNFHMLRHTYATNLHMLQT